VRFRVPPPLRIAPHQRLKTKNVEDDEPYTDEQEYRSDEKNEPSDDAIHHLLPFGRRGSKATLPLVAGGFLIKPVE
jgi:hypothetical protein